MEWRVLMSRTEIPGIAGLRLLALHALAALALDLQPVNQAAAAEKPTEARTVEATVRSAASELEEVIVSGKLDKLSDVQKAMIDAEDRFWARYNELNKNPNYDVTCRNEAEIGTRLKTRQCEAGYVSEGKRRDALGLFQGYHEANVHLQSEAGIIAPGQDELKRRVLANTQDDQVALRALVERFMLQDRYEQLRKKKFDGSRVVWD
jgi:hypothetical protein